MRIENETKLNLDEMCWALSKARPIKVRYFIILCTSFLLLGILFILFGAIRSDLLLIVCGVVALVSGMVTLVMAGYFIYTSGSVSLKRNYVKKGMTNGCNFKYTFNDDDFIAVSKTSNGSSSETIKYSTVTMSINYKNNLFIYIGANTCYIVDLSNNSTDEISQIYRKFVDVMKK